MLILTLTGALEAFDIPFVMLGANDTSTFVIKTVDTAFKYQNFGLASAMAVVADHRVAVHCHPAEVAVQGGEAIMRRERSLGFTMFNYFTLVVALFVVFSDLLHLCRGVQDPGGVLSIRP